MPQKTHAGGAVSSPTAMVTDYFRAAPVHASEKLEAGSSRVLAWLLKRAVKVAKRTDDEPLFVRKDEVVAVLLDRRCRHAGSASLAEIQHLAAPAKSLDKRAKRQRDRRKREWEQLLLPGAVLVVDARMCGLRDGMLAEGEESSVATADSDADWQAQTVDAQADVLRPVIGFPG